MKAALLLFTMLPGITAAATMPAGSTVWMVFSSNACSGVCDTSNQPGVGNGIEWQTHVNPSSGTRATGFAEVLPGRERLYLSATTGSFMYISMTDTYTVHGSASVPFQITAHLDVDGMARSVRVYNGSRYWEQLVTSTITAEIGDYNPSTASGFSEQFRVTPFSAINSSSQSFSTESYYLGQPFSRPIALGTSYSRMVTAGDVFDLAFGVNIGTGGAGTYDLTNTAQISFDLPAGVWLTSANGGSFGAPVPAPAGIWLMATAFATLAGRAFLARARIQPGA